MAVKSEIKDDKLILTIDNGEFKKLQEIMENWKFKDYQSLTQFAISILALNEDRFVSIKRDGIQQTFAPANDLLK